MHDPSLEFERLLLMSSSSSGKWYPYRICEHLSAENKTKSNHRNAAVFSFGVTMEVATSSLISRDKLLDLQYSLTRAVICTVTLHWKYGADHVPMACPIFLKTQIPGHVSALQKGNNSSSVCPCCLVQLHCSIQWWYSPCEAYLQSPRYNLMLANTVFCGMAELAPCIPHTSLRLYSGPADLRGGGSIASVTSAAEGVAGTSWQQMATPNSWSLNTCARLECKNKALMHRFNRQRDQLG
jgi:hypothetical protein